MVVLRRMMTFFSSSIPRFLSARALNRHTIMELSSHAGERQPLLAFLRLLTRQKLPPHHIRNVKRDSELFFFNAESQTRCRRWLASRQFAPPSKVLNPVLPRRHLGETVPRDQFSVPLFTNGAQKSGRTSLPWKL